MVEAVQVIFPLGIDDLQHDVALDPAKNVDPDQLLFLVVLLGDALPQRFANFV